MIIKTPIKPMITADQRWIPTFSCKKNIYKIVTIIGETKARVKAWAKDIIEIA